MNSYSTLTPCLTKTQTSSWSSPTLKPLKRVRDMDERTSVNPQGILVNIYETRFKTKKGLGNIIGFPFLFNPSQILAIIFLYCPFFLQKKHLMTFLYRALRCLELGHTFKFILLIIIRGFLIMPMVMHQMLSPALFSVFLLPCGDYFI